MKTFKLISAIILSFGAASAFAHKNDYEWARVVDVEPVYRWIDVRVPERRCWVETVATEVPSSNRVASTLAGGLIGGALGSATGHDHKSRHVGAAIGTVVGMAIGNDSARKQGHGSRIEYRDIERCEMSHQIRRERELDGYDVVYRLHGQLHRTHTQQHPGRQIQVRSYGKSKHYRNYH